MSPPSGGGTWLQMLSAVVAQLPQAVGVTDMRVPGLPIAFCNQAMVDLTGYPREQIEGHNCRFLQGKRTEAAAVRAMVSGIAAAKPTTVRVTNYRKDGVAFRNLLSLHPVHDSNGVYRFCIGVQFEVSRDMSLKTRLLKLERRTVPYQLTNLPTY